MWARCRRCGAWFWTSTDLGGKYEYVGEVQLPTRLAERAFIHGDVDALAETLITSNVPFGPVWTTASAMVEIFAALTPGASNAARAQSLARPSAGPLWTRAAELFASQARGEAKAPPPELAFAVDLTLAGDRRLEAHELKASLILLVEGQPELLRLDAARLVQVPLAGPARLLASSRDAIVLAVTTSAGDATVVLDGAGNASAFPPSATVYAVTALDDGWWQFVPHGDTVDRFVELHLADGSPRVKLPRRFEPGATWMPRARRCAGGWIVSNLIDDNGSVQALTLFDDQFATTAFSTGITGERSVTPIDAGSFWATSDGIIERWIIRSAALERIEEHPIRTCWFAGVQLICDHGNGRLVARGPDGAVLWTWQRDASGATYGVDSPCGFLVYDDDHAYLLDPKGTIVRTLAVESPDVSVGSGGTVYMKTTDQLWIFGMHVNLVEVPLAAELETTCNDRALLSTGVGRFLVVGPDGRRSGFAAPEASFTVFGTVGGPYVVEPTRLRVAAFA